MRSAPPPAADSPAPTTPTPAPPPLPEPIPEPISEPPLPEPVLNPFEDAAPPLSLDDELQMTPAVPPPTLLQKIANIMVAELELEIEDDPARGEVAVEATVGRLVVALLELTSVLTSHEEQDGTIEAALLYNEEWAIAITPLVKEPSLRKLSALLLKFLKKAKQEELLQAGGR